MGITTTIPTNLNFPNRGILERDAFVNAQETAQDLLAGAYTTALNQYATELNSTQMDINTKAEQVANQAVVGSYSQAYIDATFTPKILNTQTAKETPIDADLIPLSDSASSFVLKKLSWANIKAALKTYFDTLYMALTGNQTIDGVKTFVKSPIVPTPTTGTQAVNKDYVDSKPTLPIGALLNGYTIFENCIVAFGGEFNRADYPKLWTYLQANPSLVKTQTQWQTEATANGGICGFFSSGNGTTTFRVPNLDKAFLRPDSRSIASYQGDAIRNITGNITGFDLNSLGTEAFYNGSAKNGWNPQGAVNNEGGDMFFDASRVVPVSNENRPKNIAVLPLIVAK